MSYALVMSKTHIEIDDDSLYAIASRAFGANIDAGLVNLTAVSNIDPNVAVEYLKVLDKIRHLSPNDPPHPEEDFSKAFDDLDLPGFFDENKEN